MILFWNLLLLLFFLFYIYKISSIEEGYLKLLILIALSLSTIALSLWFHYIICGWIILLIYFILYIIFYDREPLSIAKISSLVLTAVPIIVLYILKLFPINLTHYLIFEILFLACHVIMSKHRNYNDFLSNALISLIFGILIFTTIKLYSEGYSLYIFLLSFCIFILLEKALTSYHSAFIKNSRSFQQHLLENQYKEIKSIYLDMRGWRHDYHNHIQTMKAYIALNEIQSLACYLNELENNLSEIDAYVKSGNIMVDAILNSKISLALKEHIKITCTAEIPEEININDIDLCVILGNILDNATEAAVKIAPEKRFLRIYMTILKKQLYISVQNSAREELSFNEKNYISTKRGNHGLGMKRVSLLVDKYNGYLNLQNEAGIFACEITLPLINATHDKNRTIGEENNSLQV